MDSRINFDCLRTQGSSFYSASVVVAETHNNPYQQLVLAGRHALLVDRSASEGGSDTGPNPLSLLMMALGPQISMALRAIADREGWALEQIIVHLNNLRSAADGQRTFDGSNPRIACLIELAGDLHDWQQSQLIAVANRHLPAWISLITTGPACPTGWTRCTTR